MKRFEYKIVQGGRASKFERELNELGAEGWEAVVHAHQGILLKRELPDKHFDVGRAASMVKVGRDA